MEASLNSYQSLKEWKEERILTYWSNVSALNEFHDTIMKSVIRIALKRIKTERPFSWKFAWFTMGSSGRRELGFLSDQDHGLVYEPAAPEAEAYFLELGEEISKGLQTVGYPYCQGNVMSSNPLWCKSLSQWKEQILSWMHEGSLQTMRNLHIFYDSRVLAGEEKYIAELKSLIYENFQKSPHLLTRMVETSMHIKKSVGPFGQLLAEEKGRHQGELDLKYSAFIPYVNAVRILALKEGIQDTSTIARLNKIMKINGYEGMWKYQKNFAVLLKWRLHSYRQSDSYEDTHYIQPKTLTISERNILKDILKDAKKLHLFVIKSIKKGAG
ncbi:putative signal-transduction protein [Bacillus sp. ZZV12-4809]|nr:putative signal-transduction protein [Bacillus sp. ZZV12-4809]